MVIRGAQFPKENPSEYSDQATPAPQQQCASTLEGTDTFGSYNPATATFYISDAMIPSVAEATFMYGNSGWIPLVGDWDGH
jgi:hypothetical protein